MIAAPPLLVGAVNTTDSETLAGVTPVMVGAEATPGVAAVDPVAAPLPAPLTARICTLYDVPFANAVVPLVDNVDTTSGLAVVPAARVCQLVPPSVEY